MVFDYHFGVNKPYPEVEAGFVPALQDFYDHPEAYTIAPFQIFGNLWYVGDQKVTSHLIDTGDGLILFDTGYGHTTHMMLDSIRGAGFDPMDIKIIIHSHGHFDHFGSGQELSSMTNSSSSTVRRSLWWAAVIFSCESLRADSSSLHPR